MSISNDISFLIRENIKKLMRLKSSKDGIQCTPYALAAEIGLPHSTVIKLLHDDPEKRVLNPRIDILEKIVTFFQSEGLPVGIDDLLKKDLTIPVNNTPAPTYTDIQELPLFSLSSGIVKSIGSTRVKVHENVEADIAILANFDFGPFIKKGSVFLVDLGRQPKNEVLVLISKNKKLPLNIMKYFSGTKEPFLQSLDLQEKLPLLEDDKILGVVTQISAKT